MSGFEPRIELVKMQKKSRGGSDPWSEEEES